MVFLAHMGKIEVTDGRITVEAKQEPAVSKGDVARHGKTLSWGFWFLVPG
jgi:hypothetical protein